MDQVRVFKTFNSLNSYRERIDLLTLNLLLVQWNILRDHVEEIDKAVNENS